MATALFIRACAHRAIDLPVVDSASASDPFVSIGAQTSVCVSEVVYDSNTPNWGSFCCDIRCESECDVSFVVKDKGASFDTTIGSGSLPSSSAAGEHLHLGQKIALFFRGTGLPDWAILVLVSMLPAVELRGGVPVGAWMGIPPLTTFVICVIGNMIPIAPTLLALRSDAVKKVAKPLLDRANKKLANLPTGQSRTLALALFVGVPAPGTGAWTGAIIAYLLDMPFGEAMATIFAGVALAGIIMTILTVAGKAGALVALAALCAFGGGAILSAAKKEGSSDEPSE